MKPTKLRVLFSALVMSVLALWGVLEYETTRPSVVHAQSAIGGGGSSVTVSGGSVGITNTPGTTDPCGNPSVLKSHAFANITTATTTALVAVSGTTNIYVCGIDAQLESTTTPDTVLFEKGTGAACVGTPTAITATYTNGSGTTLTAAEQLHLGFGGQTYLPTGASQGLCAVSTVGSTPAIAVDVTFVQQ